MRWRNIFCALMLGLLPLMSFAETEDAVIRIGGKKFTESYILGEIMAQLLESRGFEVERELGLGGTLIAFTALEKGEVDVYAEYSGTLSQAILKQPELQSPQDLAGPLKNMRLELLPSFGFENKYALAVRKDISIIRGWEKISDVRKNRLKLAVSHEFLNRQDGWAALQKTYGLDFEVQPLEHTLAYEAIRSKKADAIIIYSTDSKLDTLDLAILEDDLKFFPPYWAAPLIRESLPESAKKVLNLLAGRLDETKMIQLNSQVENEGFSFGQVAQSFLIEADLVAGQKKKPDRFDPQVFVKRILEHLYLTFMGVFSAVMVAVPLAILLLRLPAWAAPVLGLAGLLQTIPSMALLAFMIPFFGIGVKAAIMALFIYAILPILRNTYLGLKELDPQLLEISKAIGLYSWETLVFVRFPLGLPVILAGIRVATVINIGTATLAAFIGAGGLGEPIVTGLALNDTSLLLQGAIPAALLAVGVETVFNILEKQTSTRSTRS